MSTNNKWWSNYPWRNIQTNLREVDMMDINAEKYVDEMKSFGATIAMINVAGIIASYTTSIADETTNPYLLGDSLDLIIKKCHDANLKVMARMDFSKIRLPIYEKHPDWAYRTSGGKIVNYNGDVHSCINSEYQQKIAYQIMEEVIKRFNVDAVFFNMGGFKEDDYSYNHYGPCHCDNCKRLFKNEFNLDIPENENINDPNYRKYLLFKENIVKRENKRMADFIHSLNPDIAVDLFDFARIESNTEYKRPLPFFQYSSSSNTRTIRGIDGKKVASNCTVDFIGFYYRHVAVSSAQQKLRLYQSLANLGGLDYYIVGRLDNHLDKTGYQAVKEVFSLHKNNEQVFCSNLETDADILLVKSKIWETIPEERGWVRALTECHFLFDEALVDDISTTSDFSKYKAILLPNIKRLPSNLVNSLKAYSKQGGKLIIIGNCGIYDDEYNLREMPFRDVLGIKKISSVRDDMVSSMFLKKAEEEEKFPSMKETDVLMLGDDYEYAILEEGTKGYFSLIPPHMYGPPERCYYKEVIDDYHGLITNMQNTAFFVPWRPGTLYYREGYENTLFFMKDLISSIVGISPFAQNVSPMVEITSSHEKNHAFTLVQLVNTSGHFGTSYFNPVPINDINVKIKKIGKTKEVSTIVSKKKLQFKEEGDFISISLEKLVDYEAIVIRWN